MVIRLPASSANTWRNESNGNAKSAEDVSDERVVDAFLAGLRCSGGKIELNVCFGNSSNYRREKLEFKVMDWPSQYHAILGHPAFAKFMAVPHYAYLALKIPGPKGTIMV
jgi:hypothetical protein